MDDDGTPNPPPPHGSSYPYARIGLVFTGVAAIGTLLGGVTGVLGGHRADSSDSEPRVVITSETEDPTDEPTTDEPTTDEPTTEEPGPTGTETDPGPTDTETPTDDPTGSLTTAEQDLAGLVSNGWLSACESAEDGTAAAALNCTASASGPTRRPLVLSFDSSSAVADWMTSEKSKFQVTDSSGRCMSEQDYKGTWNNDSVPQGALVCHWTGDGYFRVAWSYDDKSVVVVAESKQAADLITWWKDSPSSL